MRGGAEHNKGAKIESEVSSMLKHLHLYGWICVALAAGIMVCLGILACLLLEQPGATIYPDARFVKEALRCATV